MKNTYAKELETFLADESDFPRNSEPQLKPRPVLRVSSTSVRQTSTIGETSATSLMELQDRKFFNFQAQGSPSYVALVSMVY